MFNFSIINKSAPIPFESAKRIDVECITHIHTMMEFVIVTEGILHMTISGKEYDISKGFGVLVPPLEPHMFHSAHPNQCHVLVFSDEFVNYFFEYIKVYYPKRHIFAVSDTSMKIVDRILTNNFNYPDHISAEAVLAPLCYDIIHYCEFEERTIPFDETVYKTLEYIDLNFREPITLNTVALAVGVHPVTLSKMFSKKTGTGFAYYVQYVRCTYAAKLMKTSNLNLSEISYESGFGSIRSFNRSFLSIYKISPSKYRQKI